MSNFEENSDAITYGYTPNAYNAKNYEPSNILSHPDNKFALTSVQIDQHLVFSVPATTFQMGSNTPYYWPPTEDKPPAYKLRIILWQLFGRVAERALLQNFNKVVGGSNEDEEGEYQANDGSVVTNFPSIAYENTAGKLQNNHLQQTTLQRNFNRLSRAEQDAYRENNNQLPEIVSRQEYQERTRQWLQDQNNNGEDEEGADGEYHVLLEFFRGDADKRHCSGYRIWILKEVGAPGDLNTLMGEVIASASAKPANGKKVKPSYDNMWRQIQNNTDLKHFAGNALYLNQNHFSGNVNNIPLSDEINPVHPTNVFSVGGWRSILYGVDGKNWLPRFYPNLDIDSERFKAENYFQIDNLKRFMLPNFRDSIYKCTLSDLSQDHYMNKYRLDQFCDNILPMLRDTYSQIGEPRATNALRENPDIDGATIASIPAFKKRRIQPQIENQYSGGSLDFCGPSGRRNRDRGLVFVQGEDDAFLIARAMTAQYVGPEGRRALENSKCNQDTLFIRINGLKKCMMMVRSIFEGNGNANVSDGLYGIINTESNLKKIGFTERYMNIQHIPNCSFHDDFVAFIFWGCEYHLCISTLHYDLYNTLINVGCAYSMEKTKNHLIKEGMHGSGKSNNIFNTEIIKCDGVVQTLTNASMLAHFFAGHQTFKIEANHEPDPTTMGGKGTSSNPQIQQKTEQKKSKLAECLGTHNITIYNKDKNCYETQKTTTVWSSCNIQAQNAGGHSGSINPALLNRYQTNAVPIKTRDKKDINYQKSAQNEMDENQTADRNMFIYKCKRIDANFAKVSAMFDLVGGLTSPDMQAFNDVYEHMKTRGALANNASRSVNRCANAAKTQIKYDAIAILFYYQPSNKVINYYIGGRRITDEPLLAKISYLFDDADKSCKLNTRIYHEMHRDGDNFTCEGSGEQVKCKIDLVTNQIYSINESNKEVLESVELESKWEHVDLYDTMKKYESGDEMVLYFQGKQTNYRSYFIRFKQKDSWTGVPEGMKMKDVKNAIKVLDVIHSRTKAKNLRSYTNLPYEDMYKVYELFGKSPPMQTNQMINAFTIMYRDAERIYNEFKTHWDVVPENGFEKRIESLLGKYRGQMITYNQSDKDRSIEKWRDLDLLMYCTVDTAIRTFCIMRDEFVPDYQDKMKMVIANIAKKKLGMFKPTHPYKYFYPVNDIPNPQMNDVDLNYISLSQKSQFTIEIQEGLKDILTPGLETLTDSIMIDRMLVSLDKQLVQVFYDELKAVVHTVVNNSERNTVAWKLYEGENSDIPWIGNEPGANPYKAQIIKFKKGIYYVHIAWVYDMLKHTNTTNVLKDAYLSALSSYKYPIPKDEEGDKQKKQIKLLTGSSWVGKIKKPRQQNPFIKHVTQEEVEEGKAEEIAYCCPAVSHSLTVNGDTTLNKSIQKKNSHHRYSQMMSGRKRQRDAKKRDLIKMSFDRHIACDRARKLNEHTCSLENRNLYKQFKYLSKEDILNELNISQPTDMGDLFNYPDSYVRSEYLHEHVQHRVQKRYTNIEKFKAIILGARVRFRIRMYKKMKSHVEETCQGDDRNDKMKLLSLYLKSLTGERWNSNKFRQTFLVIYDKTWEEYKNEK